MKKSKEGETEMKAYAWSQCGEIIVTGAKGDESFMVLSAFGWK